jgi:DNA polymerase (family 10)
MNLSNAEVADLLRNVATALTLGKANSFQVRAYENAADSIEHLTADLGDLWEEDKLKDIPDVGKGLQEHLNELFKTGKVKHFESLMEEFPKVIYSLIKVPGVGPKTAQELAQLGVKDLEDLEEKLDKGTLVEAGFSAKIAEKIKLGVVEYKGLGNRILLPVAGEQAEKIVEYIKKDPNVTQADYLGSLRRRVVTVGDLDFAAATKDPEKTLHHFATMPGVKHVVSEGGYKAMVVLNNGMHVDLLVGDPESYGALLQHFTGGKNHNIHLRTLAEKKGFSLSERGVKDLKTGEVKPIKKESELYAMLGMQTPDPELREDTGEIEAAIKHELPKLVNLSDMKGDMHLHSNFPMEPSHGPGANKLEEIIEKAKSLKYDFVGLSDHSPGFTKNSKDKIIQLIETRTKYIQKLQKSTKSVRVMNGLEIDILTDGSLSVPDEALKTLDYCVAGVHSSHKMPKDEMTKRILKALESPYVDIISHPTGRLLNQRQSYDADWDQIFEYCAKHKKLLEVNSFPNRLDLREDLIRRAKELGCKFIIDTDAHEISQMDNMEYGVSLARRGWLEKEDVVNTWSWEKVKAWFDIG